MVLRFHDIAIARVSNEDELSLWIRLEDLIEKECPNAEGSGYVAKVERPSIERATGIGLIDEVHIVARHLFRRSSQVMEMDA